VAFPSLSLSAGAIKAGQAQSVLFPDAGQSGEALRFRSGAVFESLPEKIQKVLLYGSGRDEIAFTHLNERGKKVLREETFEGIVNNLERRYNETESPRCARSWRSI